MATWYVDTTAAGANDGTSQADAWTNIRSAFVYASYTAGDKIYVRRNQTHTMTDSDCNTTDSGTIAAPIEIIGDNDSLDIWADAGDVRPIINWGAYNRKLKFSSDNYWVMRNLEWRDGEGAAVTFAACGLQFYNCRWTSGVQTPSGSIACDYAGSVYCEDCEFSADTTYVIVGGYTVGGGFFVLKNCTIDNASSAGIRMHGLVYLENVVFGGTTPNGQDIRITNGRVFGRNVVFNAATEVAWELYGLDRGPGVFVEDYDGTKGAWKCWLYGATLTSILATSTPKAAKRSGGADTVIKADVTAAHDAVYAQKVAEFPVNVGTTGTPNVDVYVQGDTAGGSVPDVQGSDAEVWVEVAAWDTGNSEYKYFDSRDKGAQDAMVDHDWSKIVVENVEVDAVGTIIVRVYCRSVDTFYIDRIVDVT